MKTYFALFALFCGQLPAQDIVIYGGTPGSIATAVSAARMGRVVTLVEYHDHIGGIYSNGVGAFLACPFAIEGDEELGFKVANLRADELALAVDAESSKVALFAAMLRPS